ncbi:histone deacetylase [Methanoregula sp.]|uniref:histone deacetylase family protein n=1 Tax=Methanoregula sp. TaxID=2052170 RepID=UPI002C1BB164|nr:histone deacetylase [Methanoregula sp.]HVP97452.1 histone deacetylase [Methanoregula sp.]
MPCAVITGPVFDLHDCPGHPESAGRLHALLAALPAGTPLVKPVPAAEADLARVHEPGYLAWLHRLSPMPVEGLLPSVTVARNMAGFIDTDTYFTPWSYGAALYAAGAACQAAGMAHEGKSAFALVRPPGHHALPAWAMGFCLINNAAVAAAHMLGTTDRIAIVDWDIHHGNGTQETFKKSERVLYCSVHAEGLFPRSGAATETGSGPGAGCTVNAPLLHGCTIGDYAHVFTDLFIPAIECFNPDLLIVSAGQDSLADDPLSVMDLHPDDYGLLTGLLIDATGLPPAFVLEGGYGRSHPAAVNAILRAAEGERMTHTVPPPRDATRARVRLFRKIHGIG